MRLFCLEMSPAYAAPPMATQKPQATSARMPAHGPARPRSTRLPGGCNHQENQNASKGRSAFDMDVHVQAKPSEPLSAVSGTKWLRLGRTECAFKDTIQFRGVWSVMSRSSHYSTTANIIKNWLTNVPWHETRLGGRFVDR